MPRDVASVIRRYLRTTRAFTRAIEAAAPPRAVAMGDEVVVGWYVNPPPNQATWVLFTDHAIYVVRGKEAQRTSLSDIRSYELPESKTAATGVDVETTTGKARVPMYGRNGPDGQYADAWLLVRILHTLIGVSSKENGE